MSNSVREWGATFTFFETNPTRVFTIHDLNEILTVHREKWDISSDYKIVDWIQSLIETNRLRYLTFQFPSLREGNKIERYVWGNVPPEQIAISIAPDAYLSHGGALAIHGLTAPKTPTWYINTEQQPKDPPHQQPIQNRINAAFKRAPRISKNRATVEGNTYCILYGKFTDKLGVMTIEPGINVTNLERTLIDIAVRPFYAGDALGVLQAYRMAKGKIDLENLVAILNRLEHAYPYHQAIGFYLERSECFRPVELDILRRIPMALDFFAEYQMETPEYSQEWRLYYPTELDV